MPHFHFHLCTAQGVDRDETGLAFSDLGIAYLDACRAIPAMVPELLDRGCDPLRCAFEITDERGQHLMNVPFAERLTRGAVPALRPEDVSPSTADLIAKIDDLSREVRSRAAELRRTIQKGREAGTRALCHDRPFLDRIAEVYGIQTGGQGRGLRRSGSSDR